MVLDATLLNTQHHKVWIKGKVEQYQEMESCPPLHLYVIAIKKGAFRSPSTKVTNLFILFVGYVLKCGQILFQKRVHITFHSTSYPVLASVCSSNCLLISGL